MNRESRRLGLKWKIGGIFTGVMLLLGAFVIGAVYQLTESTLREQLDKRAVAVATNFSDAVAGHVAGKNLLALHALARKYTLLDGVAYAYVEDGKGEIIAHTLGTFPEALRQEVSAGAKRQVRGANYHWRQNGVRNRRAGFRRSDGRRSRRILGGCGADGNPTGARCRLLGSLPSFLLSAHFCRFF